MTSRNEYELELALILLDHFLELLTTHQLAASLVILEQ